MVIDSSAPTRLSAALACFKYVTADPWVAIRSLRWDHWGANWQRTPPVLICGTQNDGKKERGYVTFDEGLLNTRSFREAKCVRRTRGGAHADHEFVAQSD